MADEFSRGSGSGLARRDFMIAAGASVAFAAGSAAEAQIPTTPPPASTSGTEYTGDVIDGKPVVGSLDVNTLFVITRDGLPDATWPPR